MTDYIADGAQFRINQQQRVGNQFLSSMAALADGGFVCVWWSSFGSAPSFVAQRFDAAGEPVGSEFVVTAASPSTTSAKVTGLADGGFVIVWDTPDTSKDGSGSALLAQVYDAQGQVSGASFVVNNEAAGNQTATDTVLLSDGTFAVIWTTTQPAADGTLSEVHARVFDAAGVAVGAEVLVNTTTIGAQAGGQLTAAADGGFLAAWTSAGDVFTQLFDAAGAKVGGEVLLNTQTSGNQLDVGLTTLSDGRFVAVWRTSPATGFVNTVSGQILAADGSKIGGEFLISDPAGNPQIGTPDVDALGDGGFVVTWSNDGGSDVSTAVWAQRYDASGAADGGRYIVNTPTTLFERSAHTIVTASGDIVTAWSASADVSTHDVSARIFARNAAPVIVSDGGGASAAFTVAEHDTAVTQVVATDRVSPEALSYSIVGGADAALFSIDAATGHLTFVAAPDAQAPGDADLDGVYEVVVAASDGELSDTQELAVTVAATGRGLLIASAAEFEVGEGSPLVGVVSATDAGATFAITGGADAALFAIDAATGELRFATSTNFEAPADADADNLYHVEVTASTAAGSAAQAVTIAVVNVNEAPFLVGTGTFTAPENSTFVALVPGGDLDGDTVSYSVYSGPDNGKLKIDSATGALSFWTAPNYESVTDANGDNVYEVVLKISDGDLILYRSIAVTVTNVNEGLYIVSNGGGVSGTISLAENQLVATTVVARDFAGPQVTYSISGGFDAAKFAIDAQTGVLSFVSAPDYEVKNDFTRDGVYDVTVAATDGLVTDTQSLAITVTNVVETVAITSYDGADTVALSVLETAGSSLATIIAANPESGLTYTIVGGADAARFSIFTSSGQGVLNLNANYESPSDANADNVYEVVVRASNGSSTDTQAFTVTVLNVNEAPSFLSSTTNYSVAENTTVIGSMSATDPEGLAVSYSLSGVDAAFFAINSTTGALSFASAPNFEVRADSGANNVYNVTVIASDGTVSGSKALNVTVTNVNEAPVITSGGGGATAAYTVNENSIAITTITSTDPENTARTYTIAGGADQLRFTINSTTGALSFVSARNFEAPSDANGDNVYEVTVRASDGTLADTQALAITVANVNETPVISSNGGGTSAAISMSENAVAVATVIASDPDGGAPTYSISGGADAALFAINASTGALTFLAAPNFEAPGDAGANNVYDVVVSAGDSGGLNDTQALAVTVTNVNEVPVITSNGGGATAALVVSENVQAVTTVVASGGDSTPSYAIVGGADSAQFTINWATGALSFLWLPDFEAPRDADGDNIYEVIVQAKDGPVDVDNQILTVTVQNVNEVLSISAPDQYAIIENSTFVAGLTAVGSDAPVTFAIAGGPDAALFTVDATTGELRFATAPDFEAPGDSNANNLYQIRVSATDGEETAFKDLYIFVSDVEDLRVTHSSSLVAENGTSAGNLWSSIDPASFQIVGGADGHLFRIVTGTNTKLQFLAAPDYEDAADADGNNVYEIDVQVQAGGQTVTKALEVTVGNVNEAPSISSNGGGTSAALAVGENTAEVTTIVASDPESGVTYSITGGADAARFTVNATTGVLAFVTAPDFEAPADADGNNAYEVTVAANDGSLTDTQALSVTVTDVADYAPLAFATTAFAIDENTSAPAWLEVTGGAGAGSIHYSITGGADAQLFWVDELTGELALEPWDFEAPLDQDGDNVYQVEITAHQGADTVTGLVMVTLRDVNEAPVFLPGDGFLSVTVAENSLEVAALSAFDPEGLALSFSILDVYDGASFAIDAQTGVLSFVIAPDFEAPWDFSGSNVYALAVAVSDGENVTAGTIEVHVTDVAETLTFAETAFAGFENELTVATLGTSGDPATTTYAITGGADAALFALDAATGALSFLAAPDFEMPADADGDNVYDVSVSATDGSASGTEALSVTVGDVNEAPVIISWAAVSVIENDGFAATVAADDPEGGLAYTIVGGADAALFTTDGGGDLYFVSGPDYEAPADADGDNVYEVIVEASDGELSDTQALSITVLDQNEAPTIASDGGAVSAAFALAEGKTAVTTVVATDADAGSTVGYAITGGADAALFAIDAATGALRLTAAPDFEAPGDADGDNVYDVVVSASDGTLSDSQAIAVTVANVNEAVILTSETAFTVAENGLAVTTVTATDLDGTAPAYAIAGGADALRFAVDAVTGALRFVIAPNFEAPTDAGANNVYDVVVSASDGTFVDTQALSVSVTNVNEAPVIVSGGGGATAGYGVTENTTAVATIAASDVEGGVTYALAGGADAARFAINPNTGVLSFLAAPDYDAPGDANGDNLYQVVVSASDGSLADTQALTVAVGNVGGMTLNGTTRAETLNGGGEEDTLRGMAGNDVLNGLGGNDVLDGGDGQDRLTGGAGADILTGGLKADDFVYNALSDSSLAASDRIMDFSHSQGDDIDLSALDANAALGGNQAFSYIGSAAFSHSAGQLRAFQQSGDTFVQADVNGDGVADFQLVLDTAVTLVSGDFIL